MKTNKIGHFVCGVLAKYGLVVVCGNMNPNQNGGECTINPATWCNWGGKPNVNINIDTQSNLSGNSENELPNNIVEEK